jgi:hypothetical protein
MSFKLSQYRHYFAVYSALLTITHIVMAVLEAITSTGIYFPFFQVVIESPIFDFSHILNALVLFVIGVIFLLAIKRLYSTSEEKEQAFSFLLVGGLIALVMAGLWTLIMGAHAASAWIGFFAEPDWATYAIDPVAALGYSFIDDFSPIIWCGLLVLPLVAIIYPKRDYVIN